MATALLVKPAETFAQHQATIAASLAHRLAVAKAAQNAQLVALLEQEQIDQQQLVPADRTRGSLSLIERVSQVCKSWMTAIDQRSQLSVQQIVSDSGAVFWRAYDPQTGKTLYAESTSDVVKWIEDNRLGQ